MIAGNLLCDLKGKDQQQQAHVFSRYKEAVLHAVGNDTALSLHFKDDSILLACFETKTIHVFLSQTEFWLACASGEYPQFGKAAKALGETLHKACDDKGNLRSNYCIL